ncbi:hypothetical protein [Tychonema sp. LEGE 06208]|nr:hypothetical protein [Tychonema sp. LEGE 06208]MBE9162085.1 hypothetical protein [Tychonema sp. LEGE 06208]
MLVKFSPIELSGQTENRSAFYQTYTMFNFCAGDFRIGNDLLHNGLERP